MNERGIIPIVVAFAIIFSLGFGWVVGNKVKGKLLYITTEDQK